MGENLRKILSLVLRLKVSNSLYFTYLGAGSDSGISLLTGFLNHLSIQSLGISLKIGSLL